MYPTLPLTKLQENENIIACDLWRAIQTIFGGKFKIGQKNDLWQPAGTVRTAYKFDIEYYFDWLEAENLCFLEVDDKLFIPVNSGQLIIII